MEQVKQYNRDCYRYQVMNNRMQMKIEEEFRKQSILKKQQIRQVQGQLFQLNHYLTMKSKEQDALR